MQLLPPPRSQRWLQISALLVVMAISFYVQLISLAKPGHIYYDELAWYLSGVSLVEKGVPSSWSIFEPRYAIKFLTTVHGQKLPLVAPYLDHPPLFSLLVGGWHAFWRDLFDLTPSWALLRAPMLVVSTLTALGVFLLTLELWGSTTALWAVISYLLFPSHLVTARYLAAEHLLALLLVIASWAGLRLSQNATSSSIRLLTTCALATVGAPLLKLSGAIVGATLAIFFALQRRLSFGVVTAIAALAGIGAVGIYGYTISPSLWSSIMAAHADRPQSFFHLWTFFTLLNVGHQELADPVMILGVIWLFSGDVAARQKHLLVALLLATILSFSAVAPREYYGWYKYTLYPFVAIGMGRFLQRTWQGDVIAVAACSAAILLAAEECNLRGTISSLGMRVGMLLLLGTAAAAIYLEQLQRFPKTATALRSVLLLTLGTALVAMSMQRLE